MRLQIRECGYEGSDPGRNADGHNEYVVQQECRGCEQPGGCAQVVLGDCVRPTTLWIRGDRLAVREVDNHQQQDDERADRPDVRHAGRA